jgi:Tfp pilus assembly protein PilN
MMNAVNLIPLERRRAQTPSRPGAPFLGLLGALVLALAGTASYVEVHDTVSTRQSELSHLRAGTAEWSAAAARYTPAIAELSQRAKGFVRLGVLLGERYDWSVLLGQLAGVMPARAQLASLAAATPIQAPAPASTGTPATSAGTATTTTTATTTPTAAPTTGGTSAGSAITISGCAASQPVVADTMVALRRLSGVSSVSLSSSSLQGGATGGSSSCALPVQFSLSLQFSSGVASLPLPDVARSATSGQAPTTAQLAASAAPTGAAR